MNLFDVLSLRVLIGIWGALLVFYTLSSATCSFVLPRGENVRLTRWVFLVMRNLFNVFSGTVRSYEQRDRVMALFAPTTLLILPVIWVMLILFGYACIYWALGVQPFFRAVEMSGSALLTLGTTPYETVTTTLFEFSEATIGLGIVALLIAYLPTMYSAFSSREAQVTMLEVRAGSPPSALEFISRLSRIQGLDENYLNSLWRAWEEWFSYMEESHTSLAPLVFFRSPDPQRSWITAAGAILDSAALIESTVDIRHDPQAQLMLRSGYLALQAIADTFRIPYDPHPKPDDPISIGQDEFDEVYSELAALGVPLRPDREQAWRDFAGWRVNYDLVLLRLAALVMAPYAPWSSDRSLPWMGKARTLHDIYEEQRQIAAARKR
ncbi:MAG: hypothetical protein OHK0046_45170 [Anaerolineae bacterium]